MAIQVSKKSRKPYRGLSWEWRTNFVIDFVRRNPGCSLVDIYGPEENKKYGAKSTIEDIVKELIYKGVLINKNSSRNNARSYLLYLINENPLAFIPDQFETLRKLVKSFCNDLENIYIKDTTEWPSHKFSPKIHRYITTYRPNSLPGVGAPPVIENNPDEVNQILRKRAFDQRIMLNVIQIPFAIIGIIYSLYYHLQRTKWIEYNDEVFDSLNQLLFTEMNTINAIAYELVKKINKEPYKHDFLDEGDEYFVTVENAYEKYPILQRICILRHRCKSIGLADQLDSILNYLIERNSEYFQKRFLLGAKSHWKEIEWIKNHKLDAIHDFYCPYNNPKNDENKCHILDTNPTFPHF